MLSNTRPLKPFEQSMLRRLRQDIVDDVFTRFAFAENEHAESKHVNQSAAQMIDQMFQEGKTRVSTFANLTDMRECIAEVITNLDENIYPVREDAYRKGINFNLRQILPYDLYQLPPEDAVPFQTRHLGIMQRSNGSICEMQTDSTTVACRVMPDSRYGFEIITAYPNLKDSTAVPTGRDISKDMFASQTYQQAAKTRPVFRTYLEEAVRQDRPFDIRFSNSYGSDELTVFVQAQNPDVKHHIFIGDGICSVKTYLDDPATGKCNRIPTYIGSDSMPQANLMIPEIRDRFFQNMPEAREYLEHLESAIQDGRPSQTHPKELSPKLKALQEKWAKESRQMREIDDINY